MNFPVFDLHCDTALALLGKSMQEAGSLRENEYHIDLNRARKLDGYAQCFACFTTPFMEEWGSVPVSEVFEREMVSVLREVEKNKDMISLAYTAGDVVDNLANGKMSAILTVEGPAGFGFDAALLQDLYAVGFRMTTLGWNEQNVLAGSHKTGGGLTDQGRDFVKEAQRLGFIIDVSHISDDAFWDIMEISEKPSIASHSNSRAVHNVGRNLTDDMFKAICEVGGVVGFNQYADFIGDDCDMDNSCDHILHWLALDPEGDHIALGGDLDGCDVLAKGFEGVQSYSAFAQKLLERGLDEKTVRKIFWDNALGVMAKCCT